MLEIDLGKVPLKTGPGYPGALATAMDRRAQIPAVDAGGHHLINKTCFAFTRKDGSPLDLTSLEETK